MVGIRGRGPIGSTAAGRDGVERMAGTQKRAAIYLLATEDAGHEQTCRRVMRGYGYTVDDAHIYRESDLEARPELDTLLAAIRDRDVAAVAYYSEAVLGGTEMRAKKAALTRACRETTQHPAVYRVPAVLHAAKLDRGVDQDRKQQEREAAAAKKRVGQARTLHLVAPMGPSGK